MMEADIGFGVLIVLLNLGTFLAMGWDKHKAKEQAYRIAERTFWIWALLGGSIGVVLGMQVWRHKTQKGSFYWPVYLILLLQVVLLGWWTI